MPASLRSLTKIRNKIGFLYAEHARIEQEAKGIAVFPQDHSFAIPCANQSTLLLGPGTTITHAAIKNLIEGGCTVQWVDEDALHFDAFGHKSSSIDRLYHQAQLWADATQRLHIICRMYQFQFGEELNRWLPVLKAALLSCPPTRGGESQGHFSYPSSIPRVPTPRLPTLRRPLPPNPPDRLLGHLPPPPGSLLPSRRRATLHRLPPVGSGFRGAEG